MKHPSPALFRSNYFWTWLAAFFSLVVCTMLFYLRTEQSRTILDGASTIRNIGQARIDLNEGFLHLTLASEPRSPFRAEEGLALIGQAVAELRRVREEGIVGRPLDPTPNGPWSELGKTVAAFSSQLDAWNRTPESARAEKALSMHLTFHQLEQYASQMDEASQAKLVEINAALSRTFLIATSFSTFLLCGLCVGVYWAGRNQRIAAAALRRSEERLRILGDNLPDGYIFEFRRKADGTPQFTYISAGVEQVNGIKAADCMRDVDARKEAFTSNSYARFVTLYKDCLIKAEISGKKPNVEEIFHSTVEISKLDHGFELLYDGIFSTIIEKMGNFLIQQYRKLLKLRGRIHRIAETNIDL